MKAWPGVLALVVGWSLAAGGYYYGRRSAKDVAYDDAWQTEAVLLKAELERARWELKQCQRMELKHAK